MDKDELITILDNFINDHGLYEELISELEKQGYSEDEYNDVVGG